MKSFILIHTYRVPKSNLLNQDISQNKGIDFLYILLCGAVFHLPDLKISRSKGCNNLINMIGAARFDNSVNLCQLGRNVIE